MVRAKNVVDVHMHHGGEMEAISDPNSPLFCPGMKEILWTGTHGAAEADTKTDATAFSRGMREKFGTPFPQLPPYKSEHLVELMNEGNVTHGVLCGIDSIAEYGWKEKRKTFIWKVVPEYTTYLVKKYPERFIGEVGVPAKKGPKAALEEMKRGRKLIDDAVSGACKGFKFFTPHFGFPADDVELCYPLYEYIDQEGLIATIHANGESFIGSRLKYCRPLDLDSVSADFPDMKIHMLHCATFLGHEIEGLAVMLHSPNMYSCTAPLGVPIDYDDLHPFAWCTRPDLFHIIKKLYPTRFMFGTDYPLSLPYDACIENVENILADAPDFRQKFFTDNARRFYGIK